MCASENWENKKNLNNYTRYVKDIKFGYIYARTAEFSLTQSMCVCHLKLKIKLQYLLCESRITSLLVLSNI